MKRALVINIARMGDLIHSTPLMQGLRDDGWEVTLLYSDGFTAIAPLLAGPHKLVPIRLAEVVAPLLIPHGPLAASYKELSDLIGHLRDQRFDLAINITHTRYSAGLMKLIGARESVGLTLDGRGLRQVNGAWANYYFNSILNRGCNRFNLVDLHRLTGGVERSYPVKIDLSAPSATEPLISQLATLNSQLLVGLVPGASTPEKRWPVESFAEAIKIVSQQIKIILVILGGPDETPLTDRLAELLPNAVNLGGKTDIPTLAAVIAKLDLLVSNDTGPIHLAAAVGTKVVDVTLGSAMAAESAPYGSEHLVVEPRIGCFPCQPSLRCSHLSCHKCISPRLVAALIESALSSDGLLVADPVDAATAKIYCTGFESDGYFELQSLNRPPIALSDVVNSVYRELWKWTLRAERLPVKTAAESIALLGASIKQRFSPPADPLETEPLLNELHKLALLASKGATSALQIQKLAKDPHKVTDVKSLGKTLSELDEQIARLAYGHPDLMPLVAQFTYAKQNFNSSDLVDLAASTVMIYNDLADWCRLLSTGIEKLSIINASCQP